MASSKVIESMVASLFAVALSIGAFTLALAGGGSKQEYDPTSLFKIGSVEVLPVPEAEYSVPVTFFVRDSGGEADTTRAIEEVYITIGWDHTELNFVFWSRGPGLPEEWQPDVEFSGDSIIHFSSNGNDNLAQVFPGSPVYYITFKPMCFGEDKVSPITFTEMDTWENGFIEHSTYYLPPDSCLKAGSMFVRYWNPGVLLSPSGADSCIPPDPPLTPEPSPIYGHATDTFRVALRIHSENPFYKGFHHFTTYEPAKFQFIRLETDTLNLDSLTSSVYGNTIEVKYLGFIPEVSPDTCSSSLLNTYKLYTLIFTPQYSGNKSSDVELNGSSSFFIFSSCDSVQGRIYSYAQLVEDDLPPSKVIDLSIGYEGSDHVSLSWTAPGNDGNQGTAFRYDIRYSTNPVGADTTAWWEAADTVANEPAPAPAGTGQQFTVGELTPHSTYYFALKTADEVPNWSGISNIASGTPVGVKGRKTSELPTSFTLSPNYPNPFNPETRVSYSLPVNCQVNLEVYNITGEKVVTLVNQRQEAGYHTVTWDASGMASGIYFYRLQAGDFVQTRKMVLIR
jgi:hypothetical protein